MHLLLGPNILDKERNAAERFVILLWVKGHPNDPAVPHGTFCEKE